jgi:hypothetical protein
MGFSTNYENVNDDYGILPEGDYEVIIRNIEERTTKKGATGLNLSLVVRNDIEQKFKDRYIFYTLWKKKEPTEADKQVQGYIFNQIMRLAKSAKLPNGKAYESVMDLCKDLMHRPIKVTLEHREWNGRQQENVKYVNASEYPNCKHVFKEKKQVTTDTVAAPPNESFETAYR